MSMKLSNWKIWASEMVPTGLQRRDVIIYGVILLSCFLLFQQVDLFHTTASSYAFLNGHFLDFYDYNKQAVGGNDYFPILYAIFAFWNLPLKLLGLTTDVGITQDWWRALSVIEIIWAKLLSVLFFFSTAIMTYKTAEIITGGAREQSKLAAGLFASAPIAIFAVFIFGQYDVIGLFFTMTGFYYYVRKDLNRFAWFFSVAISFKFLPLAIFVPLVLLAEKRLIYLAKLASIAMTVPLIQVLLYWSNISFRENIFSLASKKLSNPAIIELSPLNSVPVILVAYFIICLYTFIKRPQSDNEWRKVAVLTSVATYATVFSTTIWHPQWVIIITPFFALSALYIKDNTRSYLVDMVGMLAFVWVVVNFWVHGIDVSMLHYGALRQFFPSNTPLVNSDLMPGRFMGVFETLFFIYLFAPLLVIAFQRSNSDLHHDYGDRNRFFRARFILGVAVFVIPSLFCALVPMSIADKIKSQLNFAQLTPGLVLDTSERIPAGEIYGGDAVTQSFKAEHDKLAMVSVLLATYGRTNNSSVKLTLMANDGTEIAAQSITSKNLKDNTFYDFQFPPISGSEGQTFRIMINSPDAKPGNAITAWMSKSDIYLDGELTVNGVTEPGDLNMKLYYEK